MESIELEGLLSKTDREKRAIQSHYTGSKLGEGVYTANSTAIVAGGQYGDEGLLVARLRGSATTIPAAASDSAVAPSDSVVTSYGFVLLKSSAQSLALVRFSRGLLFETNGRDALQKVCEELYFLMNDIFGDMRHNPAP